MELAAAALAVVLAAAAVLRDVVRADRPAPPYGSTPARPSRHAPGTRPAPPAGQPAGAPATAAPPPRRSASASGPEGAGSVLGAFGRTEPDRGTRGARRAASALTLIAVTVSIAAAVGGVIYLGLSRLG